MKRPIGHRKLYKSALPYLLINIKNRNWIEKIKLNNSLHDLRTRDYNFKLENVNLLYKI